MLSFTAVPFLLGMYVTPKQPIEETHFQFTFQVEIATWSDHSRFSEKNVTFLSLDLICQDMPTAMMCYIRKYNRMYPIAPGERPPDLLEHYTDRRPVRYITPIDHRAFNNDSEPFLIEFFTGGIGNYLVHKDTLLSDHMINVIRMIGDQLNIGAEITLGKDKFLENEQSVLGLCPGTEYSVSRLPPRFDLDISLNSFVGFNLENNTIIITKHRKVERCERQGPLFFFSSRFWPEVFPAASTYVNLEKSTSVLTMSLRGMESRTENVFGIYDVRINEYGYVTESVNIALKTYQEVPPHHRMTLEEMNMVSMDISP